MSEIINYLMRKSDAVPLGARHMVGIVGSPGSGKSTLAAALCAAINARRPNFSVVVPMDGFHLPNAVLDARGNRALKGIPATFDGAAFIELLGELRRMPAQQVACPGFDRRLDEPTPGQITIEPHHRLLLVEGNYLLLKDEPWHRAGELLDETWYLDTTLEAILPRLLERHMAGGRTAEGAREKIESTDLPNARLIEATRKFADRMIEGAEVSQLLTVLA